jgi:hypothetical protein
VCTYSYKVRSKLIRELLSSMRIELEQLRGMWRDAHLHSCLKWNKNDFSKLLCEYIRALNIIGIILLHFQVRESLGGEISHGTSWLYKAFNLSKIHTRFVRGWHATWDSSVVLDFKISSRRLTFYILEVYILKFSYARHRTVALLVPMLIWTANEI